MLSHTAAVAEVLMKKGELGDCMFFVMHGMLSAFQEVADEVELMEHFVEGSHFGEAAFFAEEGLREISVRAETHCSLEGLSFKHLADLVSLYDDLASHVHEFAAKHKIEMNSQALAAHVKEVRQTTTRGESSPVPGTGRRVTAVGERSPVPGTRIMGAPNSGRTAMSSRRPSSREPNSGRTAMSSRRPSSREPNSGRSGAPRPSARQSSAKRPKGGQVRPVGEDDVADI
jgi:hypothetical protein